MMNHILKCNPLFKSGIVLAWAIFMQACGSTPEATRGQSFISYASQAVSMKLVAPQILTAGDCTPITLKFTDESGFKAALSELLEVQLQADSNLTVFQDEICSSPVDSLVFFSGEMERTLYIVGSVESAQQLDILPSSLSMGGIAQKFYIAEKGLWVRFDTKTYYKINECIPVGVSIRSKLNNALTALPFETTLLLSSTAGQMFFADNACSQGIQDVTIPQSSQNITYIYAKLNAAVSFTATIGNPLVGLDDTIKNSQSVFYPEYLLLEGPTQITNGSCTAYTVKFVAGNQSFTILPYDFALGLMDTLSTGGPANLGTFYLNSSCTQSMSGMIIPQGTTQQVIYYRYNGTAQDVTLKAIDDIEGALFPTELEIDIL
ncbi:MAG: hypothetical protein R3A11_00235 [Bdellovibrionota bacterium]